MDSTITGSNFINDSKSSIFNHRYKTANNKNIIPLKPKNSNENTTQNPKIAKKTRNILTNSFAKVSQHKRSSQILDDEFIKSDNDSEFISAWTTNKRVIDFYD